MHRESDWTPVAEMISKSEKPSQQVFTKPISAAVANCFEGYGSAGVNVVTASCATDVISSGTGTACMSA
jgi:hypothetical protein